MLLIKNEIRKQERKKIFKNMEEKRNKQEKEEKKEKALNPNNNIKNRLYVNNITNIENNRIIESILKNNADRINNGEKEEESNQYKRYIPKENVLNAMIKIREINKFKENENNKSRNTIEQEKYIDILMEFEETVINLYKNLFICEIGSCKQFYKNRYIIQEKYLICQECKLACCNQCIMVDKKDENLNYCRGCKVVNAFGGGGNSGSGSGV